MRAHLIDAARPFIFDTGLAPAAVGAAWAALRVLIAEPWRAQAVLDHAPALARDVRRLRAPGVGGGVGHPRRARGGVGRRGRVPGPRRAGRLLPPADRACRHVAAAADGAGVAVRRRDGLGARGSHRSVARRASAPTSTSRERSRRHGHRHRRRQDGGHRGAGVSARGWPASTSRCASRCRPAAPATTTSPMSARLSGVSALHGTWRYPEPLAPAAAAQRAGLALPTRDELVASVASDRREADPGRGRGWAVGRTGLPAG